MGGAWGPQASPLESRPEVLWSTGVAVARDSCSDALKATATALPCSALPRPLSSQPPDAAGPASHTYPRLPQEVPRSVPRDNAPQVTSKLDSVRPKCPPSSESLRATPTVSHIVEPLTLEGQGLGPRGPLCEGVAVPAFRVHAPACAPALPDPAHALARRCPSILSERSPTLLLSTAWRESVPVKDALVQKSACLGAGLTDRRGHAGTGVTQREPAGPRPGTRRH